VFKYFHRNSNVIKYYRFATGSFKRQFPGIRIKVIFILV